MTDTCLPVEQPVFSHHVRALLARQALADRNLVGASYRRGRNRQLEVGGRRPEDRGRAQALASVVGVDFHQPSPLRRQVRQSEGGGRVPHFDMKPIVKSHVPTSEDAKVHHRARDKGRAGKHFDYLRDVAKVTIVSHLNYRRDYLTMDELLLHSFSGQVSIYARPGQRVTGKTWFECWARQSIAAVMKRIAIGRRSDQTGLSFGRRFLWGTSSSTLSLPGTEHGLDLVSSSFPSWSNFDLTPSDWSVVREKVSVSRPLPGLGPPPF